MGFARAVVGTIRSKHVPFIAGSIAYSAFISLLPLLVLAVLVATAIGGDVVGQYVIELTEAYLSPAGQDAVVDALERATAQTGLSVLSVLVLLWAVLRLFRGLNLAFSILYGTDQETSMLDQLLEGIVVLVAISLAIAGTVAVVALFAVLPEFPYGPVVDKVILVGLLSLTLWPMYYVFPDVPHSAWEVLPGVVVAALGWTALAAGFQFYAALTSTTEIYGFIGGIILLLTWLYLGALVLLLGVTVNVVLSQGSSAEDVGLDVA